MANVPLDGAEHGMTTAGREAAAADILRLILDSGADPQPVFDAIVASCARQRGVAAASLLLRAGEDLVCAATAGRPGV